MNRERMERLLKLVNNELERPTLRKFDMNDWGFKTPCGTVACLLGLAAVSGEFEQDGLTYNLNLEFDDDGELLQIRFDGWSDSDAGQEFFELTDDQTIELFMDANNWSGKKALLERKDVIERMLNDEIAP